MCLMKPPCSGWPAKQTHTHSHTDFNLRLGEIAVQTVDSHAFFLFSNQNSRLLKLEFCFQNLVSYDNSVLPYVNGEICEHGYITETNYKVGNKTTVK